MEIRSLLAHVHFDDLLSVVPAARVGREDGPNKPEERDADQVADEEVGLKNGSASAKQNTQ